VLHARYIAHGLISDYEKPFDAPPMHEVVFNRQNGRRAKGVHTLDIAKRLIDYGFHPMTIYFPLIVQGAMLIGTDGIGGRQELDQFLEAMRSMRKKQSKLRSSFLTPLTTHALGVSMKLLRRAASVALEAKAGC